VRRTIQGKLDEMLMKISKLCERAVLDYYRLSGVSMYDCMNLLT
jgi:hypothetical protein